MMGKSKELYQDFCNLIVAKHANGFGGRQIAKPLNSSVSTTGPINQKCCSIWACRIISDRGAKNLKIQR